MTCESNAVMAATLANNGTCPITGERVLQVDAVNHVIALMYSCGMSISSGQFAFNVGNFWLFFVISKYVLEVVHLIEMFSLHVSGAF